MKLISKLSLLLAVAAVASCSGDEVKIGEQDDKPITFASVQHESYVVEGVTRANLSDFPSAGQIGVVAGKYASGGPVNWNTFAYIQNEEATATSVAGNTFHFTWATAKYWPIDDAQLSFLAYSPLAKTTGPLKLGSGSSELEIVLTDPMVDVLYASSNITAETTPYKNSDNLPVDLGVFKHALSKLTVVVKADASMDTNIKLTSLKVTSPASTAILNLLLGDTGMTINATPFVYTLVSSSTVFLPATPYQKSVLMFPGTHAATQIEVALTDGTFPYSKIFTFADFTNIANANPLELVRAKNTALEITVKSASVITPKVGFDLKGSLTAWDDKGDFGATIQ